MKRVRHDALTVNDIPYEYCAYRYLELWEKTEKHLVMPSASGRPSAAQIRSALNYFRVARNFKNLSDEVAEKISTELLEVSDASNESYRSKVGKLATRFKDIFGQSNLSAASKLLWLRNRSPYLIYDSRAVNALRCLGNKFDKADYISYCEVWEGEYEGRSNAISLAAHGLVNLPRTYTAAYGNKADDELTNLVHSKWFIERVFDIYLWEIGASKNLLTTNRVRVE